MSKSTSFSVDDILKPEFASRFTPPQDTSPSKVNNSPSSASSNNKMLNGEGTNSTSTSPLISSGSVAAAMAVAALESIHHRTQHQHEHHLNESTSHHQHHHHHPHHHIWPLLSHSSCNSINNNNNSNSSSVALFDASVRHLLNGHSHEKERSAHSTTPSTSQFKHQEQLLNGLSHFNHLPHLFYRQPIISGPGSRSDPIDTRSSNCYPYPSRPQASSSSSSPSRSSSSVANCNQVPLPLVKPDLNVINNDASNNSQVHPVFAISPSSGITYSWVSPPKSLPRKRTVFSRSQRIELEKKFQAQKYISKSERVRFARELGLKDSQVKVWFINRRTKWRNDREKRLMIKSKTNTNSSNGPHSERTKVES